MNRRENLHRILWRSRAVPRRRGDEPNLGNDIDAFVALFPAGAGMNRTMLDSPIVD